MAQPLMPKATAVWLVENTALTFEQISEFCGLHALEVQAIADGEVAVGMQGMDPIANNVLTQEEIDRCQANPKQKLKAKKSELPQPKARHKGARYTPVAKRQERPDAIAWLLKNYPELTDSQISRLVGTTKSTITAVRDRSHWNISNIKPQNPVGLGICSAMDLEKTITRARRRLEREAEKNGTPLVMPESTAPEIETYTPEAKVEPEAEPTVEDVFGKPATEGEPENDA